MNPTTYSGVYAIPVTPFNEDKSVDYGSLRHCLEFLVEKKTDGILLPANVSEASKLSDSEKDKILEAAMEVTENKIPIIAGVTGVSTEHVIERANYAEGLGVASIMSMPPVSYSVEDDFYRFYESISNNTSSDIWVQNNKPPLGPSVPPGILIKIISEIERVNYLKEESSSSGHMHTLIRENCGSNLKSIMGGSGGRFIIDEFRRGSNGVMPSGHMVEAHRLLWDQLLFSDQQTINPDAISTWNNMLEALNFEFVFSVSAYKYFFWKRGIIKTNISREPTKHLDKYDQIEADRILKNLQDKFF